jgi:hypothetical protein
MKETWIDRLRRKPAAAATTARARYPAMAASKASASGSIVRFASALGPETATPPHHQ